MIVTPSELEEWGIKVFGNHWRAILAEKLNRSKQTITAWANGSRNMPRNLASELNIVVDTQIAILNDMRWS